MPYTFCVKILLFLAWQANHFQTLTGLMEIIASFVVKLRKMMKNGDLLQRKEYTLLKNLKSDGKA